MSELKDALIYDSIKSAIAYASIPEQQFNSTNMRIPRDDKLDAGNAIFFDVDSTGTKRYTNTTRSKAYTNFKINVGATSPLTSEKYLDQLINNTSIKRACCLRRESYDNKSYKVDVKLPYDDKIMKDVADLDTESLEKWKKYGFIPVEVEVPKEVCNSIDGGTLYGDEIKDNVTHQCDRFMSSYCENTKFLYEKDLSGSEFNTAEYLFTTPECGCYIDRPLNFKPSVQTSCFAGTMCLNSATYKDLLTRQEPACKIQECTSIMNLGKWESNMGGNISDNKFNVIQNCFDAEKAYKLVTEEGKSVEDALKSIDGNTPYSNIPPGAQNVQLPPSPSPTPSPSPGSPPGQSPGSPPGQSPGQSTTSDSDSPSQDEQSEDEESEDEESEEVTSEDTNNNDTKQIKSGFDKKWIFIIIGIVLLIIIIAVILIIVLRKKNNGDTASKKSPTRKKKSK